MPIYALNPPIEQFESVKRGHVVRFAPKDAIGGARGLRKDLTGAVRHIDPSAGTAQVRDWIVPLSKVRRLPGNVWREWSRAQRREDRQRVYGKLGRAERKRLETCAKDARLAFASLSDWTGPRDAMFNAEVKRRREALMKAHGIHDLGDVGQCKATALFLEKALAKSPDSGPQLKGVHYISAESGTVGPGDTVVLGGVPLKLTELKHDFAHFEGKDFSVSFPWHAIPVDSGAPIRTTSEDSPTPRPFRERRRRRREKRWCFRRDKRGRFRPITPRARNPQNGSTGGGVMSTLAFLPIGLGVGIGAYLLLRRPTHITSKPSSASKPFPAAAIPSKATPIGRTFVQNGKYCYTGPSSCSTDRGWGRMCTLDLRTRCYDKISDLVANIPMASARKQLSGMDDAFLELFGADPRGVITPWSCSRAGGRFYAARRTRAGVTPARCIPRLQLKRSAPQFPEGGEITFQGATQFDAFGTPCKYTQMTGSTGVYVRKIDKRTGRCTIQFDPFQPGSDGGDGGD